MKKLIMLPFFVCFLLQANAQSSIEEIQEGTYLQINTTVNNKVYYAGQPLGINGLEILPSVSFHSGSGFYINAAPTFYTDKTVTKKSAVSELNAQVGFVKEWDFYQLDASLGFGKVNYGNKFFRNFLNNNLTIENTFSFTDNISLGVNPTILFGNTGKKGNVAVVLENNLQYDIYAEEILGAEQVIFSPQIAYYFGSDKLISTTSERDTLDVKSKKVLAKNTMSTLSFLPGVEATWQKGGHEVTIMAQLPIYPIKNTVGSSTKLGSLLFGLGYAYYWGF